MAKPGDTRTIILDDPAELPSVYDALNESLANLDFTDVFQDRIFPAMEHAHQGYFNSETDASGQAWAPLAASTIAKKGHSLILWETGKLENSLTSQTGDAIREAGTSEAAFGTSVPYATFHEEGTSKMPARPPVGVSEDLLETITGMIADSVIAQISGA